MPPTFRPRLLVSRRFASSSTPSPSQNPQVQKAVEGAQRVYQQGTDTVKRLAGPLGERVGNTLGGQCFPSFINPFSARRWEASSDKSSLLARLPSRALKEVNFVQAHVLESLSRTPNIQHKSRHLPPPTSLPGRKTHTPTRSRRLDERLF